MITNNTIGKYGRFANGVWQLTGLIGIARRSGQDWALTEPWTNHQHRDQFGSTEDIDLEKYFVNPFPHTDLQAERMFAFNWGWDPMTLPYGDWNIMGHFQSEKYFSDHLAEVRHYLTMHDEQDEPFTAVHIRRGDYDNHYHPIAGADYYRAALEHVPGDSPLLVFSDDNEAASALMATLGRRYTLFIGDYLKSFRAMKRCQHFICANSSYSLMAAILAPNPGKVIVCPRAWFGPSWGPGMNEVMTKDLYPAGAIVL